MFDRHEMGRTLRECGWGGEGVDAAEKETCVGSVVGWT